MAVQSQTITCPTGNWTSIAQQLDRRQALLVQCPQVAPTVVAGVGAAVNNGVIHQILAANALRTRVAWCYPAVDASTTDVAFFPGTTNGGLVYAPGIGTLPLMYDTGPNSPLAASVWNAIVGGAATHSEVFPYITEVQKCAVIVLGVSIAVPTYTGLFGTTPFGIWTSPYLASGPAIFRLSAASDFDLVKQEWFAWPIGSGNVTVQVYQSFDSSIDVPPTTQDSFRHRLPQLSPMALRHLEILKSRLNGEDPDVP